MKQALVRMVSAVRYVPARTKRRGLVVTVAFTVALTLFVIFASGCPPVRAIIWQKTFGGTQSDVAHCVQMTSDGGYILAGKTRSSGAGNYDMYLVKITASGNEQWSNAFGGAEEDRALCVQQTSDGGYILAGSADSYGAGSADMYLVKTDASGDEQWSNTFGGVNYDMAHCVRQTGDGGYIVAGETASFGLPQSHLYLVKTDGLGEEEWSRHFAELGTTRSDVAYCVQQTADLGFILAGRIHNPSTTTDCDVYLVKVTSGGTIEWTQALGGTGCDDGRYVQETSGGGYIVAGYTYSYGAGAADMYLIKTDASGNAQWSKTFGGTEEDKALCVQQTTDGGYILAGPTFSYGAVFENDMYLVKTDASGNELWSNTFGDTGSDTACSVRQTTDNGYILAGSTFSYGAGLDDMYVVKTLFNGNSGFPPSK